ncbi:MAG: hypothetical protein IPK60_02000 [Sandaracinaceae bacterium]|nr:hypothetical protein [Sandaracinaceae bacterium]
MAAGYRAWLAKPLVRFVAIGVCIFVGTRSLAHPQPSPRARIVVTAHDVAAIRAELRAQLRRDPTETEFDRGVDRFVLDSALAQRAKELSLLNDSNATRHALAERMQFVLESEITEQNALRRRELIWEAQAAVLASYDVDRRAAANRGRP